MLRSRDVSEKCREPTCTRRALLQGHSILEGVVEQTKIDALQTTTVSMTWETCHGSMPLGVCLSPICDAFNSPDDRDACPNCHRPALYQHHFCKPKTAGACRGPPPEELENLRQLDSLPER